MKPRYLVWFAPLVILCCTAERGTHAFETWQINVGYDQLANALGAAVPGGNGVAISQIESEIAQMAGQYNPATDPYFPDANSTEFTAGSDPLGQAVQFIDGSGHASAGISNHATTTVGRNFYGNTFGLAKTANTVTVYGANDWLQNVLNVNSSGPPLAQPFKVQNSSWIGTFGNASADANVLQRYDYVIETGDMTAVVGLNNNDAASLGVTQPPLLSHSLNAIAVGRSDSKHSRGLTTSAYFPGRVKPDIVAPAGVTSAATAYVSSAATLLYSSAGATDAAHNEVMKATLMAGATEQQFTSFVDPATGLSNPWDHTPTRPLDDLFGAGQLNVFNSYKIQQGGEFAGSQSQPAATVGGYGWDYQDLRGNPSAGDMYYNFVIPAGSSASELSIMLSWNAKVTDTNPAQGMFTASVNVQNLDLHFYDSTASFLGTELTQSISTIDNVEHIYMTNLGPGTYTLKVTGAAGWDYGLAWRTATQFDAATADFDGNGVVDGADFLAWQRGFGTLVNATHAGGDANGDGAVDAADLAILQAGASSPALAKALATVAANLAAGHGVGGGFAGVPEPATLATAALAVGFSILGYQLKRRRAA